MDPPLRYGDVQRRRENSDFLSHTDCAGGVVDFHGHRTAYISRVVETVVNLKECMELARHSDPKLTMKTSARMRLHDLSAVLERLPGRASAPLNVTETA